MTSHRRPSLYLPIIGWALQILVGAALGAIAAVLILLAILWVMALSGTAW